MRKYFIYYIQAWRGRNSLTVHLLPTELVIGVRTARFEVGVNIAAGPNANPEVADRPPRSVSRVEAAHKLDLLMQKR